MDKSVDKLVDKLGGMRGNFVDQIERMRWSGVEMKYKVKYRWSIDQINS